MQLEMIGIFRQMTYSDKALPTTKAMRNAGKMLNINIVAINKISGNLKINRFKIPHYS